jgi:hypothetical protein
MNYAQTDLLQLVMLDSCSNLTTDPSDRHSLVVNVAHARSQRSFHRLSRLLVNRERNRRRFHLSRDHPLRLNYPSVLRH